MIQRDESKLTTMSEFGRKVTESLAKLSPAEKARLRISLRKYYGLKPEPEPDAYEN